MYLNAAEANPAGGGRRARIRLKPGEHAARGGTLSRPQDRKPKLKHGHARNLCQKRPEGQHPGKRWGWGGSLWVVGLSHGGRRKAYRLEANRQWLKRYQPAATGGAVRRQRTGVQERPTLQRRVSNSERGRPDRPPCEGLDRLRLRWREGVGAAIVVGDGERPSQGEGPQGLERNLSVRNPQGSIL